jgi:hypothetical protein
MARPTVPFLKLVEERRFDAKNKRHRAKLLENDSSLAFVAKNPDAPRLWKDLAEIQGRYRLVHGRIDRSHTSIAARQFQLSLERLDEDGQPLTLVVLWTSERQPKL